MKKPYQISVLLELKQMAKDNGTNVNIEIRQAIRERLIDHAKKNK